MPRMLPKFPWSHPVLHHPAIWHPAARRTGWTVVEFERRVTLPSAAQSTVWISASQRFTAWIDGRLIARGPARSDPDRWGAVRIDLDLPAGDHLVTVRVDHRGAAAGMSQMGPPAFLLIVAEGPALAALATSPAWRCRRDRTRSAVRRHAWGGKQPYYVVGCGERIRPAEAEPWVAAAVIAGEAADGWGNLPLGCRLRPEPIPAMAETPLRFARCARAPADLRADADRLVAATGGLTVPAGRRVRVVLDVGEPTNAWPMVATSGGRGAKVRLVWAEAPYIDQRTKGNRAEVAGKRFYGHRDELRPAGGQGRFELLWFRAFRYLAIEIRTADEPLTITSIDLTATAFPLGEASELTASGPQAGDLPRLLAISDRTIRLCAHEVFFDCPHYEQCQFPGDSRLQALYHYARFGDDRLARKAIDDFAGSARFDGLIPCRWPSEKIQHIPTYALHTVGMLDDFRIWRGDAGFVRGYLPMARAVVAWFHRRLRPDGLLGRIPFAPFVDWSPGFHQGNAVQDEDGGSSHLCLLLAEGLRCLAALEEFAGLPELAPRWLADRAALIAAVRRHCWCPQRDLLAETPQKQAFSRHTQYLAVGEGLVAPAVAAEHLRRTEANDLIPVGTFYFQHYRLTAARLAGLGGELFPALSRWRSCLEGTGLNTWPETDGAAPRSDCHAWSSAWVLSLIQGSLGLSPDPAVAGMGRLRLRPDLTGLDQIAGILPTPRGPVVLNVERQGEHLAIELDTPTPVILADARTLAPGRYRLAI